MKDDNERYTVGEKTMRGTRRTACMAYDADLPAVDMQGVAYSAGRECDTWGRKMLFHPIFAPCGK